MLASSSALPRAKNIFASVSRQWPRFRDRIWAKTAMGPGGNSVPGPSAQYSAVTFSASVRSAVSSTAVWISAVLKEPSGFFGGPGTLYCNGEMRENEAILPQCGVSGLWTPPPQLVASGAGSGTHRGCQYQRLLALFHWFFGE
jgi:hypothetical protein